MDSPPATGLNALVAQIQERLAALRSTQQFDWQPTVEPPPSYERILRICSPPEFSKPVDSIDQSRQIIRDAIREYLDMEFPPYMLLIKALPGTGKTTLSVEAVDTIAADGRRVGYAGPRHDLYRDVVAKSANPLEWYEWLPRQAADEAAGKMQTCNYAGQMIDWLNKGYQAMDFCRGVCGWDFVNQECWYHDQKHRKERVIYIQHQHVTLGHPLEFHVLFGDESPLAAFTHEWRIPSRWILPPGMDVTEPLTEILSQLSLLAAQTSGPIMGPDLLEMLGGAQAVLEAVERFELPTEVVAAAGEIHRAEEVEGKPYFHLFDLAPLLLREARQAAQGKSYPHRIIVSPGYMTLLLRRLPDFRHLPPHIIWLDATGRADIYEKVFRRPVKVIDAQPRMFGHIYQVVDRANGKSAMLQGKKRTDKAKQAEQLIERVIETHGYQRATVISYKDFVEQTDLQNVQTAHFYAARGTNAHEEADAVFVVGAPQSNIYDVVKLAKMLYFERDEAFRVEWVTREQAYSYADENGDGRSYPVSGFWNDPDLQAVLEVIREDEIIQAAHRGRPVNHPCDIWLLTNVPIASLPPDKLMTMREVMLGDDAPADVDTFLWAKVQDLMRETAARHEAAPEDEKAKIGITLEDLMALGCGYTAARKYLKKILEMPHWDAKAIPVEGGKGGRPKKFAAPEGGFRH